MFINRFFLQEKLPNVPIAGMYNKYGGKVRLTFKLELDQLWIGTKGIWNSLLALFSVNMAKA